MPDDVNRSLIPAVLLAMLWCLGFFWLPAGLVVWAVIR